MVILLAHILFAMLMLVGAVRGVAARDRRGLLWGSSLTTIGLVGTLWVSEISAITLLLAILFLIFDFCIFTFSGSIRILPKSEQKNPRLKIYPALVVWLVLTFISAALYFIWALDRSFSPAQTIGLDQLLFEVLGEFWGRRGFSLYLIVALIFGAAIGSFFMIEREKQS